MINVLDSAGPAGYVCATCTFPTGTGNTRGKHLITQSGLLADSGLGSVVFCLSDKPCHCGYEAGLLACSVRPRLF